MDGRLFYVNKDGRVQQKNYMVEPNSMQERLLCKHLMLLNSRGLLFDVQSDDGTSIKHRMLRLCASVGRGGVKRKRAKQTVRRMDPGHRRKRSRPTKSKKRWQAQDSELPTKARGYWDVKGLPNSLRRIATNWNDEANLRKHKRQFADDQQIMRRWSQEAKTVTLPKGTKLYGTYPSSCDDLEARYDNETGKTGKYFSTGMYIPLGMILEYDKPAKLCTYELLEDTQCFVGKYSFRQIEALRFYKSSEDAPIGKNRRDNFVLNTDPEKSYNHIDSSLLPIHELFEGDNFDLWEGEEAEVFLTAQSLEKIRSVGNGKEISVSKARKMVESKLEQL